VKRNPLPPAEYLHELFWYDRIRGVLIWKVERGGMKVGDIAGARRGETGYLQVSIDRRLYRVHLVIWKMVTGEEPPDFLDHENTIKNDNRWENLREATKSQNVANQGPLATNKSGVKGVYWCKRTGRWTSQFWCNGKNYFVGNFDDLEEAKAAYQKKYREVYGEFARFER
jgi:hypothetical protein